MDHTDLLRVQLEQETEHCRVLQRRITALIHERDALKEEVAALKAALLTSHRLVQRSLADRGVASS